VLKKYAQLGEAIIREDAIIAPQSPIINNQDITLYEVAPCSHEEAKKTVTQMSLS
jgi:hypothetical protein